MKYPHLAARLYNTPLLVEPKKAEVIENVFRSCEFGDRREVVVVDARPPARRAMEDDDEAMRGPERIESASLVQLERRPEKLYDMTRSGIAVIPIVGELVQRTGGMQPFSGMIPYAYIGRKLETASRDPEVKAILLEIDSPGGEVNGCFELAESIVEARKAKPLWAHANEMAFSAAYALACSASKLMLPKTGGVGSVGVIALHVDMSKRDAQLGVAFTYVFAGDRKKDFNPHEPLSDPARAALQDEIDRVYGIFVAHVAKARGIDPKSVIATQAGLLFGGQAVEAKFADGVQTFAETVEALEAAIARRDPFQMIHPSAATAQQPKEVPMSTDKPAAASQASSAQPEQPAAVVDQAKVTADARKAERERISAILGCEEAKGRAKLAQHLASETDVSVEEAKKTLAASAVEAVGKGAGFSEAMNALKQPKVGADDGAPEQTGASRIDPAAIFESRRAQN